jgi:hypothetical protein
VVTEGVRPLLEYLCCQTWYQSLFEDPAHVVDRDREDELSHLHFLSLPYIYGLRGLFHCVCITRFIQEHFLFHSKRFLFSQDTTITVRSKGIKFEYTFFKIFCREVFWVLFRFCIFLFPGCYSFGSVYSLFPCPVRSRTNQK